MRPAPRTIGALAIAAGVLAAAPGTAYAQRFDLSLSPTVVSFPPSDPDAFPVVTSAPVTISYRVRQHNAPWQITVLASGDLNAGGATVDISNVSWVAPPAPPPPQKTVAPTAAAATAPSTVSQRRPQPRAASPEATAAASARFTERARWTSGS